MKTFLRPQMERDNYMAAGPPRRETGDPMPKVSMSDFLFGNQLTGMMKKQQEILKRAEDREKKPL